MVTARGPNLHACLQLLVTQMLLGDALGHAFTLLAVSVRRQHAGLEAVAFLTAFHDSFQPGDDVAVPEQDRQRLAVVLGILHRLGTRLGNGIVETDDAVFLDLHGNPLTIGFWNRGGACRCSAMRQHCALYGTSHAHAATEPALSMLLRTGAIGDLVAGRLWRWPHNA
jgi:hypothetical protein